MSRMDQAKKAADLPAHAAGGFAVGDLVVSGSIKMDRDGRLSGSVVARLRTPEEKDRLQTRTTRIG